MLFLDSSYSGPYANSLSLQYDSDCSANSARLLYDCSVVSDSLRPHGPWPVRLLCPWDSPGKNTGGSCHALLHGIFPTQKSNPGLLHCRQILYCLSHEGSKLVPRGCIFWLFSLFLILKALQIHKLTLTICYPNPLQHSICDGNYQGQTIQIFWFSLTCQLSTCRGDFFFFFFGLGFFFNYQLSYSVI